MAVTSKVLYIDSRSHRRIGKFEKSSKKKSKIYSSSITSILEDGIVRLMKIIFSIVVSSPSSKARLGR